MRTWPRASHRDITVRAPGRNTSRAHVRAAAASPQPAAVSRRAICGAHLRTYFDIARGRCLAGGRISAADLCISPADFKFLRFRAGMGDLREVVRPMGPVAAYLWGVAVATHPDADPAELRRAIAAAAGGDSEA